MKRTIYILFAALLASAMCLAGCEKERHHRDGTGTEDNFDYGNATGKHVVQETFYTTTGDVVKVRYQWNNTRLVKMSILDSMEVAFSYTGDRVSAMRCEFAGYTMDYTLQYTDGRLTTVNTAMIGTGSTMQGMEMSYAFEYGGDGNVSAMQSTTTLPGGYSWTDYTYYSWSGGNLVEKSDDNNTVRYGYDSHPTPYALDFPKEVFLVFQTPEMTSLNNVTRIDTVGSVSRVINWTYTNDGYPASNGREDVGFNYYLYANGDGSTGPGSGDNDGGSGGGGVTPTPIPYINTSLEGTCWQCRNSIFLVFETQTEGTYTYGSNKPFTYSYSDRRGTLLMNEKTYSLQLDENNSLFLYQPSDDVGYLFLQTTDVHPTLAGTDWSYRANGDGWYESYYISFRTATSGYVSYQFHDSYANQHESTTNNFTYTYNDNHGVITYNDTYYTSDFTVDGSTLIWNQHILQRIGE